MNASCARIINLQNTTTLARLLYLPSEKILYTIVWPCIIFIGLTGNILFIWTVKRVSSLHSSTYIYLASLAFTDIGILICLGINNITDVVRNQIRFGKLNILTVITGVVTFFLMPSSLCFISLASLERYLAVCHPIRHHILKGFKRTLKLIVVTLLICFAGALTSLPYQMDVSPACVLWPEHPDFINYPSEIDLSVFNYQSHGLSVQIGDICITFFMMLLSVANYFMYIRIVQKLYKRKHNKALQTTAELEKAIHQASVTVIVNGSIFS